MAQSGRVQGVAALSIVGRIFLGLALGGLALAGLLALFEMGSGRNAQATGSVVAYGYGPKVEFVTAGGSRIRFESGIRSTFLHVGDSVRVAYARGRPEEAKIDSFVDRWFLPGLSAILAGAFFLVGAGMEIAGRRFGAARGEARS